MKPKECGPQLAKSSSATPASSFGRASRSVLVVAFLGPLLWYFGPALVTGRGFAFRDAAHYYHPLFQWISRQWASGQIPLWNPLENCGVPVLADATSSVFYPPKALFALPLSFAIAFKLYVIGHVMLAALTSFYLARRWRTSRLAAGLCAVSYAFGGNVLFQYCNVVYLVGAAWLPLALLAGDRMLTGRGVSGALALAMILALMVLGGDPQMAYNAGLLVVLQATLLWWHRPSVPADLQVTDTPRRGDRRRQLAHHGALLIFAALAALLLSAIQVLPSSQWTSRCQRAVFQNPRSLSEIPAYLNRADSDDPSQAIIQGLLGTPPTGTHQEHIYHFSVGPWRFAELLWPNVSGRMFPINRRWTNLIPAEGRIWTPSLYAGLLPLLLGLSVWRLRGRDHVLRWVSSMTLLATWAALGWYGLGWLLQEFRCGLLGTDPGDVLVGAPVGGLYWLMVVVLPGYALFRFPAKLLVIAALGLSILAARGVDRATVTKPKSLRRFLLGLTAISSLGLLISLAIGGLWPAWTRGVPADALFGPFDAVGALTDLRITMLHTIVLSGLAWWILGRVGRWPPERVAACLLLATAVDLATANGWMILTVPDRDWQADSDIVRVIRSCAQGEESPQPFRILRGSRPSWWPERWTAESDENRMRQGLLWDRATLHPKYNLSCNLSLVESYGSCTSHDYLTLLRAARHNGPKRPDGVTELSSRVANLLGANYLVLPGDFSYPATQRLIPPEGDAAEEDRTLWYSPRALPRAWIVHDVVTLPPLQDNAPKSVGRRTRHVLVHDGTPRDFQTTAVVETDAQIRLPSHDGSLASAGTDDGQERCRIIGATEQHLDIDAELKRPGLLVVSDTFYPGWSAKVISGNQPPAPAPILRTNRIMRGVVLPSGKHRVVFQYRPTLFYLGAAISITSWTALLTTLAIWMLRRRRTSGKPKIHGEHSFKR